VPRALQRGPDPLSLVLQAMLDAAAGRDLEWRSFDGRRVVRARLGCAEDAMAILPAALGGTHQALLCEAEGTLLAGRSKRWSEPDDRALDERRPMLVWLVPDVGGLPHWPVRIEAESPWGAVVIDLDRLGPAPG